MRGFSGPRHYHQRFSRVVSSAIAIGQTSVDYAGAASLHHNGKVRASVLYFKPQFSPLQHLSTQIQTGISWNGSSCATLLRKLEIALKDHHVDEAWEAFGNFKSLHGFPKQSFVSRLIISMSYSSKPQWLRKAHDLVLIILKEKPDLLHSDSLTRLALTLVRTQMPVRASTILRIMLEKEKFPLMDIWNTLFFHLVKTQIGSYLASDILIEFCECFLRHKSNVQKFKQTTVINPHTTIFNLVLNSCVRFGSTLKAQQIVDLMPRTGVVADANSIIIIARVYEMIGQRDELMKLKEHVDGVSSVLLNRHYQQFYDSLLTLHFKYNDIDAAAEILLDLYRRPKSSESSSGSYAKNGLHKPCLVQIGSSNLRMGYKLMVEPYRLQNDFVVEAQSHSGLILFMDGKLVPSNKAISKIINGYVRERKVGKLSGLLVKIQKEMDPKEASLSSYVIDACIQLGWLETAHDILDDMESAAVPIGVDTYTSLLKAYCKENMLEESKVLLKQMRKLGMLVNLSDKNAVSSCLLEDAAADPIETKTVTAVRKSHLAEFLNKEIRCEDKAFQLVYELNSSILFFCKAKMMEDALKTYMGMQETKVHPTVQTFGHLVNGYSSLHMYREITILWGEIKRRLQNGVLTGDRDLFECLLRNFLRGGYFERVMEIINHMMKHNMYTDKWSYRREYLKFHKDLYMNLKASNARTDAQRKRLEHVRAFRRWVGIDQKA